MTHPLTTGVSVDDLTGGYRILHDAATGRWAGQCLLPDGCGSATRRYQTRGHPSAAQAEARITEHLIEHRTGQPMTPQAEFLARWATKQ